MQVQYRIGDDGKVEEYNKEIIAIQTLQMFEPPEGYYLAFSGGKDSIVILDLAMKAGVKFDAHYNLTTVDPPELVSFVKTFSVVNIHRPEESMFQLIRRKQFLPSRYQRWCCELLKESGGENRIVITGVRKAESVKRSRRRIVENCLRGGNKIFVNPIIEWSDFDVWSYIYKYGLRYCKLYDEGFKRLGCVLCPMHSYLFKKLEIERWPKIARAYKVSAIDAYNLAIADGKRRSFKSGEEFFNWWLIGKANKSGIVDQGVIFE